MLSKQMFQNPVLDFQNPNSIFGFKNALFFQYFKTQMLGS